MEQDIMVSVIMAAYNAGRTIGDAVGSVLAQSYANFELIIIDDCSTDNTVDVVSAFDDDRICLLRNQCNMGVSQTRHRGLTAARGEWVAVLDSDDMWAPDKLSKQVDCLRRSMADIVFTGSAFITDDGRPIGWTMRVPGRVGFRQLLKQNVISNSSTLVSKRLFLKYEEPCDDIHEDFACWLKMLRDGYKAVGIDEPLLIYRLSAQSKTSNKWKSLRMNWHTYRTLGLGLLPSAYYMAWYVVNGLRKYRNLKHNPAAVPGVDR